MMNDLMGNDRPKEMEQKDVSVVIVNYNTRDMLRDCIGSIKENTHDIDYEVIVVDNNSHDGSVEMLRKEFPDVMTIEAGVNLGFGRANNLGMSKAVGKYLFLLNSDTILLNNAIKIFYDQAQQLIKEGYRIGALGAVLLNRDRKTCHSYGNFITPSSELKELITKYLRFLKDHNNTNPPRVEGSLNVDYVTGADMFVSTEVFHITGGFDPDFFMYCEEVDWQKRMAQEGYDRFIVDGPEIVHLEGGSEKNGATFWSPGRLANLYSSRKIYRKKHYNKIILPVFRAIHFLLDIPALLGVALSSKRKEYLRLIKLK